MPGLMILVASHLLTWDAPGGHAKPTQACRLLWRTSLQSKDISLRSKNKDISLRAKNMSPTADQ